MSVVVVCWLKRMQRGYRWSSLEGKVLKVVPSNKSIRYYSDKPTSAESRKSICSHPRAIEFAFDRKIDEEAWRRLQDGLHFLHTTAAWHLRGLWKESTVRKVKSSEPRPSPLFCSVFQNKIKASECLRSEYSKKWSLYSCWTSTWRRAEGYYCKKANFHTLRVKNWFSSKQGHWWEVKYS